MKKNGVPLYYDNRPRQANMIIESPRLNRVGYYGDFSSNHTNDNDEGNMIESKGYDISPSFYPCRINGKFYPFQPSQSSNRTYQPIGRLPHRQPINTSKRKNSRGDVNNWQSIVYPVY